MVTEEPLIVSTTFERQEHADELAKVLLQLRLVACAQVHGPVKSMYWWKDEIEESVEFVLSLKTFSTLYSELENVIQREHPYDVPEIVAEKISHISPEYLAWMKKELAQ